MTGTATPTPDTSTHKRTDQLRHRAVLHEGKRRDEQHARSKRARKHQPLVLTAEQLETHPLLARHLATHDGWPPKVTRRSNTMLLNLDAMHTAHGPLVLVTFKFHMLDGYSLYSPWMLGRARALVNACLDRLALPKAPYTAKIARAACGLTHGHHALPLAFLPEPYASLVNAAAHGPGGGCDLVGNGFIHGVVILDTPKDRERVAAYISRHPDERLDTPGTLAYLDALEDDLRHREALRLKVEGAAGRLSWSCNVLPLRRAADSCL